MPFSLPPGLSSAKSFEPLDPLNESLEVLIGFRERVEYNAQRYLDGHPLFIASAFTSGSWATNLTRNRPFIVSPTRTQKTRPWYAKAWRDFGPARSPQKFENNPETQRSSTPKPRPSSCYRPYRESQGPPATLANNLEAQRSGGARQVHVGNSKLRKTPQEQYCHTWLTNVANDPSTINATSFDARSPSPLVEGPAIAQGFRRNGANKPSTNANPSFALPREVVTNSVRDDAVDDRLPERPPTPYVSPSDVEVVSVASQTVDEDEDMRRRVVTPNASDRISSPSVIELDSNSGREITSNDVSNPSDGPLALETLIKETDAVIRDHVVDTVRPLIVERPNSLGGKIILPLHYGRSLEKSEGVARPQSDRHTSTTVEQSAFGAANQSTAPTLNKGRSVHEQTTSRTKQLPVIPDTVAKPRLTSSEPRSYDQETVLDHAERVPPDHSTAKALVCKLCDRQDRPRLVRSIHGPKTICDKCAYRVRQEYKVEEAVTARMALARPPESRQKRQTAYQGNPYEDASAAMSRRHKRQRLSSTDTDVDATTIAGTEDPLIDHGPEAAHTSSRSATRPSRTVGDRKSNQTETSTPVNRRPLKTLHTTIMKQMFAKTPLQELKRTQPYIRTLLAEDTEPFLRGLLKVRDPGPRSDTKVDMLSARAHQGTATGPTTLQNPARANAKKKRRMMTFDTPVLGQQSKRPRVSESEVAEARGHCQDEPEDARSDDAVARHAEAQAHAGTNTSEIRKEASYPSHRADFKKPALPTPITDTEHVDQASPSVYMRSLTPLPQRSALSEQNTNKVLTPRSSEKLKNTLPKLADRVEVAASPIKSIARPTVSFDGAVETENHHSESQYMSTQTAMNFAFQDFQKGLESPDKLSPIKQSQKQRKPYTSWHEDVPSSSADKIISSPIKETPVSAPMDTQAIFDQYRFTPSTPGSSPLYPRGRSTQTPVITPSTVGTSASASSGRLKPVASRSRSRPRTSLLNMINAQPSSLPKSLSQSQGHTKNIDDFHIDSFLDETSAELAA